jgi:hypothetical protein
LFEKVTKLPALTVNLYHLIFQRFHHTLPSACKDEPKSYLGTGTAAQLTRFLVARGRAAEEGAARVATVACQVGVHQLNQIIISTLINGVRSDDRVMFFIASSVQKTQTLSCSHQLEAGRPTSAT